MNYRDPKVCRRLQYPLTVRITFPFFFGKNRDDDQSQRPKVRGTDQSHVPEGDVKNLRMWRAALKQGATNAMPHKAREDFHRRLPSVMKHVIRVGVYKLNCPT